MVTLTEIHNLAVANGVAHDVMTATNIDDILWYAKSKGITELSVLPNQLVMIWQFLVANVAIDDIELHRQYFIEGKCSRILGVDITVAPPTYVIPESVEQ